MKYFFKIIKLFLKYFLILLAVYITFFIFFVWPNDHRIKSPVLNLIPIKNNRIISYDLISLSDKAGITHENYTEKYQALIDQYEYINDNRSYHLSRENMHVSLGWYPLRIISKNCLFAPAPTSISYDLVIPNNNPQLEFSCGLIDKAGDFIIKIVGPGNNENIIFKQYYEPLPEFPFKYKDTLNKHFYQYWNVQMEDRDHKWYENKINLNRFAGQKVRLVLETSGNMSNAFWANPIITEQNNILNRKPNLILIVVDSLRKDHVGTGELTPNIDKLTETGVSFEKAFANGNMTKQSWSSFLTSRLPYELGDISLEYLVSENNRKEFYSAKVPTLASVLKTNGYYTGLLGTISLFTDGAGFGVDFGFDDQRILERYGISNTHITDEAVNWLSMYGDRPFGLVVSYDPPHGPYKPPVKYFWKVKNSLDSLTSEKWYRTMYEADVLFTDTYVGKLLYAVNKLGLENNTLVVLISDHGENLDIYTARGNKKAVYHDHGISLKDRDVNVPMIMRMPGKIKANTKVNRTVELIDLMPTIFDLLDVNVNDNFRGKSLYEYLEIDGGQAKKGLKKQASPGSRDLFAESGKDPGPVIYMRGNLNKGIRVNDKYIYIRNFEVYRKHGKPVQNFLIPEELYDIEIDPDQNNNIIDNDINLKQKMRSILDSFEPEPEENIINIYNRENNNITGTITAKDKIDTYSLAGNGEIINNINILKFSITDTAAIIKFTTKPYNSALKVDIKSGKTGFPLSKILVSSYNLPLFKPGQEEISSDDLYLMKGISNISYPERGLQICWGRETKYRTEWEKQQGVTGTFKEMLGQWGYLSEPSKKQ